jgi:hypothetical protein
VTIRAEKIDAAVCAASELISALESEGPVNSAQVRLLVLAAVRASVSNAEPWEIKTAVERVAGDLSGGGA